MIKYNDILSEYTYQDETEIVERIQSLNICGEREARDIINSIVLWKVNRQVNIGMDLFCRIREFNLTDARDLNKREPEIREIVHLLLQVKGVRIAMASTFLKMFYPDVFPIIDQRAYRELYGEELPKSMKIHDAVELYLTYIYDCHRYYNENCLGQIAFSDLDKVLYQLDINKGNRVSY